MLEEEPEARKLTAPLPRSKQYILFYLSISLGCPLHEMDCPELYFCCKGHEIDPWRELPHRQKTPILKDGVPSQSFVIFYLLYFFASYLHRWSTGSIPTSQNNHNAKKWFCFESAAFYIRIFHRRRLLSKECNPCNSGDTFYKGLHKSWKCFFITLTCPFHEMDGQ